MISSSHLTVVGVGNPWRSDDRLGLLVVEALKSKGMIGVTWHTNQGDLTDLMEAMKGPEQLIIIDAMASQTVPPGTILRLDVSQSPLPATLNAASSHMVSVSQAIELARTLGSLPPLTIVFTMEGQNFTMGEDLSAPVAHHLEQLISQVIAEITTITSQGNTPCMK